MSKLIKYLVVLVFLSSVSIKADSINAKPGMWKWSMTMQMVGMSFEMPPTTYTSCVTKKDLIPQQSNENQQCKVLKNNISNNSIEWKMECKSDAGMSISDGNIQYTKTTAKGEIKITTSGMTMISKISGKRIGACK